MCVKYFYANLFVLLLTQLPPSQLLVHAVSPTTAGTMALAMTVLVSAGIRTLDLTVQTVDVSSNLPVGCAHVVQKCNEVCIQLIIIFYLFFF